LRRLNQEEIKQYLDKFGYELIGEYQNSKSSVKVKTIDGYLNTVKLADMRDNQTIQIFSKKNPYSVDNIKLWLKLHNREDVVLLSDKYEHMHQLLQWKCTKDDCGETFEASWNNIKRDHGCPYCAGQKVCLSNCVATKKPDWAKQWHPTKNGDLTPYDVTCNSSQEVWWQCDVCGYEWKMTPNNKSGCLECSKNATEENNLLIADPELCKEWNYKKNNKSPKYYFPGSSRKVWWKCSKCDYEWEAVIGSRYYTKVGCPKCDMSHGENAVLKYLINNNIKYLRQYRIKPCKNKYPLPFDFAIFNNYNDLLGVIEYQGQQHYKPIQCFGGENRFKQCQQNDSIKTNYCLLNNISLLKIPYWDFNNIDCILDNFLFNFNQITIEQNNLIRVGGG
jgi:hypothetical protein